MTLSHYIVKCCIKFYTITVYENQKNVGFGKQSHCSKKSGTCQTCRGSDLSVRSLNLECRYIIFIQLYTTRFVRAAASQSHTQSKEKDFTASVYVITSSVYIVLKLAPEHQDIHTHFTVTNLITLVFVPHLF